MGVAQPPPRPNGGGFDHPNSYGGGLAILKNGLATPRFFFFFLKKKP